MSFFPFEKYLFENLSLFLLSSRKMKIKLLWPMVWKTWNQNNDFLYVIIKTIVANSGINSHKRIKQLTRGFSLDKVPNQWVSELDRLKLYWYLTKTNTDMEIIGPLIGYFLRFKAENFCRLLSNRCTPKQPSFERISDLFNLCQQCVRPIIVELEVIDRTITRFKKFIQISDEQFFKIKSETFVHCTKKITMYQILPEYEDWAWKSMSHMSLGIIESLSTAFDLNVTDTSTTVDMELYQEIGTTNIKN